MEESAAYQERTIAHARCVNLDWLEVFCIEDTRNYPHDVAYFTSRGIEAVARSYGTRIYDEMFTIYDADHLPIIEVRRAPCGRDNPLAFHVLDHNACHIRLHNRTCYRDDAAVFLQSFLMQHGFIYQRISRVDLCLDFERFDSGDDPLKFLIRYMAGKYSKINQANIAAHGKDLWDGRAFNSVSWGSPKSAVSTKFYNKTLELREGRDKPYIRQAWALAGLVDDFVNLTKRKADGTIYNPTIWRVEFSIRSSVKGWAVTEDFTHAKRKIISMRNNLGNYATRPQLLDVFASLASKYFHFKKFIPDKRKDRCPDKVLFRFNEQNCFYAVEHVATSRPAEAELEALRRRLEHYRLRCVDPAMLKAVSTLLDCIDDRRVINAAARPWSATEVELLRRLVAYRINNQSSRPVADDEADVRALLAIERSIWSEEEAVQ